MHLNGLQRSQFRRHSPTLHQEEESQLNIVASDQISRDFKDLRGLNDDLDFDPRERLS